MNGFLTSKKMKVDMLNQGKIIVVAFLLLYSTSCNNNSNNEIKRKTIKQIGKNNYNAIYLNAVDSIISWSNNNLGYYQYCGKSKNCFLDSLLCFNSNSTRLIGAILKQQLITSSIGDDIDYFYGEKINNNWYFFSGPNLFVLRENIPNQNIQTPLSYEQLHDIALTEIFSAYLTKNGEINEAWFDSHFEGPGWGNFKNQESADDFLNLNGRRFIDKRKFFEAIHLQSVKNNWNGFHKDTIKSLP